MRFRNSRLRTKVTALLLSLTALWVFAAWVTLREGVNLLWVATLDKNVAQPSDALLSEVQRERRLSVIALTEPGSRQRAAMSEQRIRSDKAIAEFRRQAAPGNVGSAASGELKHRIDESFQQLIKLEGIRKGIDAGTADRIRTAATFTGTVDSIFSIYDSLATLDDKKFAKDTRALIALNRAREVLSQEDTFLVGSLNTKRLSRTDYGRFLQISGVQQYALQHAVNDLEQADNTAYKQLTASTALANLRSTENILTERSRVNTPPPVTADQWNNVAEPALTELAQTVDSAGDRLVGRAKPIAIGVVVRLALAGGLGLLAVIASIVVSITTARALVRQLEKLRNAAQQLADERLPSVVERLGHGEQVDVATEAPPLEFGDDEIGQVGRAFNAVQETAIRTAVEQAELRRGIRDILLSLARRTQTLVHRQLNLLDAMERRETGTDELEDLFRVDHLATRMRRNAENLIVLSGSTPARGWRRSVPMVDVVRGAVAEVEDYARVNVQPIGPVALAGRAVGDVTHLLAELIENAISFSPSYTSVQVGGHMAASGFVIEVEDSGLGMSDENIEEANALIADPPEFNLSSTARLGLYVVSRLAERYRIKVSVKHSAYGGTTAVVLIPRDLVTEGDDEEALVATPAAQAQGQTQTGTATAVREATETAAAPAATVTADPPRPAVPAQRTDDDGEPAKPPMTKRGLPMRIPQASLAPPLRADPPPAPGHTDEEPDEGRSPEEIRAFMGAYQKGTLKGRSEAAKRLADDTDDEESPPDPPADDETQA